MRVEARGDERGRRQCRRDCTQAERALEAPAQAAGLLLEPVLVAQHAPGPGEHAVPLGRDALEAPTAAHERDPELALEVLDRAGERGLAYVTGLRGAAEVLLAVEGVQIFELSQEQLGLVGFHRRGLSKHRR